MVNDQLQVLGIPNVRIVDASIMPTITSGNTNSPVIAIAEKACEMMLAGAAGRGEGRLTSAVADNSTALPTDYTRLTVAQLKIELKQRDLPMDGKKAELVARLDEHDVSPSSSIAAASSTTDSSDSSNSSSAPASVSDLERDQAWRKEWQMEVKGTGETEDGQMKGPYSAPRPWYSFQNDVKFTDRTTALLLSQGFEHPTPIQSQAWPVCMEGRDIISVSRTGSGKTLGFLLPIFQRIRPSVRSMKPQKRKKRNQQNNRNDRFVGDREPPQALVLAPTRELAVQIEKECRTFGRQQGVRSVAVYGGASKGKQMDVLRNQSPQIIVATPGRLQDLCEYGAVNLSKIQMVVLDEADLMLDMGFKPQLESLLRFMPKQLTHADRPLPSSPDAIQPEGKRREGGSGGRWGGAVLTLLFFSFFLLSLFFFRHFV